MWHKYIQPRGIVISVTIIKLKDGKRMDEKAGRNPHYVFMTLALQVMKNCYRKGAKFTFKNNLLLKDTCSSRLSILRLLQ